MNFFGKGHTTSGNGILTSKNTARLRPQPKQQSEDEDEDEDEDEKEEFAQAAETLQDSGTKDAKGCRAGGGGDRKKHSTFNIQHSTSKGLCGENEPSWRLSRIAKDNFNRWFQQFWIITGASTKEHPAPFPFEPASRLVQMFSFTNDMVLDPFCGTATVQPRAAPDRVEAAHDRRNRVR